MAFHLEEAEIDLVRRDLARDEVLEFSDHFDCIHRLSPPVDLPMVLGVLSKASSEFHQ